MRPNGLTDILKLAALGAASLVAVACSGTSESVASSTTANTVRPATTLPVPNTPTTIVGPDEAANPTTTSTSAPIVVVGLPTSVVFPAIEVIDPTLSLRTLASGDLDRLDARFRQDERVDVFLEDVDARGVYKDEELVAVAVAVAVTPGAASTAGFVESFADGAVAGGIRSPVPVVILDQELQSWLSADTGHLLWSFENIFLIVSGRDAPQVRDIASAIVTMVIAPPEPPEPVVCGEDDAGADGEPADANEDATAPESEVVAGEDPDAEECVAPEGEVDSATTTSP